MVPCHTMPCSFPGFSTPLTAYLVPLCHGWIPAHLSSCVRDIWGGSRQPWWISNKEGNTCAKTDYSWMLYTVFVTAKPSQSNLSLPGIELIFMEDSVFNDHWGIFNCWIRNNDLEVANEYAIKLLLMMTPTCGFCNDHKLDRQWFKCTYSCWCIGCLLKRFSINVKKKCKKKWRWPSRKMKIWYKYNNNAVSIFA